uniref:Uncharacterized protein n=1 Tax=Haptolina brevifila TaxID=156173 RepID=A0A7S2DER8_9EUKA|mmetsp:Transcript_36557/g.72828  ORF Transcript_36557/g.72828 Transcript_36557/m.72828 type:complete len:1182 (+) Transcript_36557:428-3973(+)
MREGTIRRELHKAVDAAESLQLKIRVRRSTAPDGSDGIDAHVEEELAAHQERRRSLQGLLARSSQAQSSPELLKARSWKSASCYSRCMHSSLWAVFTRSLNGLLVVWLYFMDVISDIEVMMLLFSSGYFIYGLIAASLLFIQFVAVYLRVLPYLRATFGRASWLHQLFLYLGLPMGMILLDLLMFLEPFGLLPIVPLPDRMRQFIPAYKATRIIAEVMLESLPQCLLQSYIFVTVMSHLQHHTESVDEVRLINSAVEGATFADVLPRSIVISVLAMLKTWIELVYSAREAGISVRTKVVQLWNVGHGLPLDALKRGAIFEWSCTYHLANGEVAPLLDALIKNSSLSRLHMAEAGLDWTGPEAEKLRSGAPLIEAIVSTPACLSELKHFVISQRGFIDGIGAYEIPVARLRKGRDSALDALREAPLLRGSGPNRVELMLMADLLRKNRRLTVGGAVSDEVEASEKAVLSLHEKAKRGEVSRSLWEEKVTELMAAGETRRAHFRSLLDTDMLHDVGFSVGQMQSLGISHREMREVGYTAEQLRSGLGLSDVSLRDLGYSPLELHQAGLSLDQLHTLGCTATDLRELGYTANDLRRVRITLVELRDAGYEVVDLREANFKGSEMRTAGFTAADLKRSKAFSVREMKESGYTAAEMKAGGIDAARLYIAGYDSVEVSQASFSLQQLANAGYAARELRRAGHTAAAMREAGFSLEKLRAAEYQPAELQSAGYDAAELREAGTSLFALKQANTPVETLKEAGYKADRLKQQGYTAAELANGGFTAKELRGWRDMLYAKGPGDNTDYAGYTAKELRDGNVDFSAAELLAGGYTEVELREGGYSATALVNKGFTCAQLLSGGYSAKELYDAGFGPDILYKLEVSADEMRRAGLKADHLLAAGYNAFNLKEGGYTVKDISHVVSWKEMRTAGFRPVELAAVGCDVNQLLHAGYPPIELREAGYSAKRLFESGATAPELEAAGYGERALYAMRLSVEQLRKGEVMAQGEGAPTRFKPYRSSELKELGYSAVELRDGGFAARDVMVEGGYTEVAMTEAGYKRRTLDALDGRPVVKLRLAGYGCRELKRIGFPAADLHAGGYSCKEMSEVSYGVDVLRKVGYSAADVRGAGHKIKAARDAGFGLRDLRVGGYPWKEAVIFLKATHAELVDAGYDGIDPRDPAINALFKQYRPE